MEASVSSNAAGDGVEVIVLLPRGSAASAEDVAVEVLGDNVLHIESNACSPLQVALPFPVDPDTGRVRLRRAAGKLVFTASTRVPPQPAATDTSAPVLSPLATTTLSTSTAAATPADAVAVSAGGRSTPPALAAADATATAATTAPTDVGHHLSTPSCSPAKPDAAAAPLQLSPAAQVSSAGRLTTGAATTRTPGGPAPAPDPLVAAAAAAAAGVAAAPSPGPPDGPATAPPSPSEPPHSPSTKSTGSRSPGQQTSTCASAGVVAAGAAGTAAPRSGESGAVTSPLPSPGSGSGSGSCSRGKTAGTAAVGAVAASEDDAALYAEFYCDSPPAVRPPRPAPPQAAPQASAAASATTFAAPSPAACAASAAADPVGGGGAGCPGPPHANGACAAAAAAAAAAAGGGCHSVQDAPGSASPSPQFPTEAPSTSAAPAPGPEPAAAITPTEHPLQPPPQAATDAAATGPNAGRVSEAFAPTGGTSSRDAGFSFTAPDLPPPPPLPAGLPPVAPPIDCRYLAVANRLRVSAHGSTAALAELMGLARRASAAAERRKADRVDQILQRVAETLDAYGYAVLDNYITEEAIAAARKELRVMEPHYSPGMIWVGKEAETGAQISVSAVRGDIVLWLDDQALNATAFVKDGVRRACGFMQLQQLLADVDELVFEGLRPRLPYLAGLHRRSDAMMAVYPGKGARFAKHVDNTTMDGRRLTVLTYLNPGWRQEQGGALRLFPVRQGASEVVDVQPVAGRVALFLSAEVAHEVMPAFAPRHAVTLWYFDAGEHAAALTAAKVLPGASSRPSAQAAATEVLRDLLADEASSGIPATPEGCAALGTRVAALETGAQELLAAVLGLPSRTALVESMRGLTPDSLRRRREELRNMGLGTQHHAPDTTAHT